jgi:hypothetical protein
MLFGVPFAAGGIMALIGGVRLALSGKLVEAALPGIMGLVFTTVGVGIIVAGYLGRKAAAARNARMVAAPDAPWLWREDWASHRVEDGNRSASNGLWAFALLWNLIALPAAVAVIRQGVDADHRALWFVLLFPLIGLGLLAAAVHASMRSHRFGHSTLELVAVPVPVGREIAGRIRVPHAFVPQHGITVTLTCSRVVVTRSGKDSSTTTTPLWQDQQTIPGVIADGGGISIPFAIGIPADALPCDDSDPRDKIIWQLGAAAVLSGVDYDARFDVPVFHTAESDAPAPAEMVAREQASLAEYRVPADAPFRWTESPALAQAEFPMGRNAGVALGLTAFTLVWTAVVVFLFLAAAPLLFRLVFGFFDAILLVFVTWSWLGHSRLRADSSGLWVESGLGPWTSTTRYSAADLKTITPKVGMTAGNRVYYDLTVSCSDGRERVVSCGFRDLRSAEWVADRLLAATPRPAEREAR